MPYSDTRFHLDVTTMSDPLPGVRYTSGLIVYDEVLLDGRLISRYWTPDGQIRPERQLPVERLQKEMVAGDLSTFRLAVEDCPPAEAADLSAGWTWQGVEEREDESGLRPSTGQVRQVNGAPGLAPHVCPAGWVRLSAR